MSCKKALYAGSFDPFTMGHLSIVEKSAKLFDKVIIGIAQNSKKKRNTSVDTMKKAIENQIANLPNVAVAVVDGLVADYCTENDIGYLIRGLRDTTDYLYEENIAKINREINVDLLTIYFRADNEVISSSMVRELVEYGKDVSRFVPPEVLKILQQSEVSYG